MTPPDWQQFRDRLVSITGTVHRFQAPCTDTRIREVESEIGALPFVLRQMILAFNGAELFVDGGASVTLFGISPKIPVSEFEWAPEWYIDKMTVQWRMNGERVGDFTFAVTDGGGLCVLQPDARVREWDTAVRDWSAWSLSLEKWMDYIVDEYTIK